MFISCGFDGYVNDPLGGPGTYLETVYEYLIEKIYKLIGGKIIAVLEGGYNLENLAKGSE